MTNSSISNLVCTNIVNSNSTIGSINTVSLITNFVTSGNSFVNNFNNISSVILNASISNLSTSNVNCTNMITNNINYQRLATTNYQLTGTIEGGIFTINTSGNGVILQSSVNLTNYTVNLPLTVSDGLQLFISSDKNITNLSIGNSNIPVTSMTAYSAKRFVYNVFTGNWYSI